MGTLVLNGATSGSTTLSPVDAVTATITLPSATATVATLAGTETLSNKTLSAPVVTGTVTGPIRSAGAATGGSATKSFIGTNTGSGVGTGSSLWLGYDDNSGKAVAVSGFYDGTGLSMSFSTVATAGTDLPQVERMRIGNTGTVGIGNTVSATIEASNGGGKLVVGTGSGTNGMTIYGGTTSAGVIFFADGTGVSDSPGAMYYSHLTDSLGWIANGGTKMTLSAAGDLNIVGALSKGSGSFRIDHPLPALNETHHLVHSFIEGPQADLIYRGKIALVAGKAEINIDAAASMTEGTFELLCRDVQCFTSNETDWNHVRGSVSGNILSIECQDQTSTAMISWMVIGERKDKHMMDTEWTDDNGKVIVEPLKPAPTELENK